MAKDLLDDRFGRFRELPLELARLGHEVQGVCLSYRQRQEGAFLDKCGDVGASVSWHSLNLGRLAAPGLARYYGKIRRLATGFNPDVIWVCSDSFQVVFGVWLSTLLRTKCIADLYDHFEAFTATRLLGIFPLFKRAVKSAAGVTCFSQRLADRVTQNYLRQGPTTVIENGVRTDLFHPRDRIECRRSLGLPQNMKIIGTAGALYRNRDVDTLFHGFELLRSQDQKIHLAIAGPREHSVRIPQGANVHDLGILSWDQVPLFLNALDVAVSCYLDSELGYYSFPQKAYEIMACRTPLAAAAVGTMKDLLAQHPECSFEPKNPESLARAVRSQLTQPTKLELTIPTWADSAKKLERFFLQVLREEAIR
ncbi:MAG: glycosyltransferase [Deltaproteobacteria bacterium]|nr:glycosyltransferase [Deltaproteobacteria bacterium]